MSRSEYYDDADNWNRICWRGAVNSALKGKRGQAFIREAIAALDALPEHKLIANKLEADGQFCTIGAVGKMRGIDMSNLDPEDYNRVAATFGIAQAMAREIVFMNDEGSIGPQTPANRWAMMRDWLTKQLK